MRFREKLLLTVASVAVLAGTATAVTTTTVQANGTGNQICYGTPACLNAWNGGPFVKVYPLGAANNDFTMDNKGGGVYQLRDTGPNGWAGHCVGDAYNDPNNASTSLDTCGTGGAEGNGTNFNIFYNLPGCPTGSVSFRNVHWSAIFGADAWLGPPNNYVNGSEWYLNQTRAYCFTFNGAA